MKLFWVCVGGAFGSGARYLLGLWAVERFGAGFPWGTLAVNVLGCGLLGALMRIGEKSALLPPAVFVALTAGVMGGFTTYSTFNFELIRFGQRGELPQAIGYLVATVLACLLAGIAGYTAARTLAP